MKYKIDTRENFDIITPLYSDLDTIMAGQLNELVDDSRENGRGLLIDMVHVHQLTDENLRLMETLHHEMYEDSLSLVFCHVHTNCRKAIADASLEHVLNLTPTIAEAIDIISMEGLERELLGGE